MSNKILGILNLYDSPSLGGLTKNRTLGSTSFLGRFALMDFALSNFTNSDIDEINVLVKDNFRSVAKHCGSLKNWASNTKIGRQNYLVNDIGLAIALVIELAKNAESLFWIIWISTAHGLVHLHRTSSSASYGNNTVTIILARAIR